MGSCYRLVLAAALTVGLTSIPTFAEQPNVEPVRVIFDTDMDVDLDDALALAMLHTLADRGEVALLAVTVSTDDDWSVAYVDLVNTYFGRPRTPIGRVRGGVTRAAVRRYLPSDDPTWVRGYAREVSERMIPNGRRRFARHLDPARVPDAVTLLRRTLSAQPDHSVTMIQVGFSTNLARLLDSQADGVSPLSGVELVRRKVRLLSAMAGDFRNPEGGRDAFNVYLDVPSAHQLFEHWPTPVVLSGGEIGANVHYRGARIATDFLYDPHHPILEAYVYMDNFWRRAGAVGNPYHDHASFDLTSVLVGVRPDRAYFDLSPVGLMHVLPDATLRFSPDPNGHHRYLILRPDQRARAQEAMEALVSQPPRQHQARSCG